MQSDTFTHTTSHLRELGGQRVWSLMVSLFGDLAQDDGSLIDGPALTAIMDVLQVKPEATRVALHRLRNDGWITSQKSGRISQHGLTSKGRTESTAASPKIYAQPGKNDPDWQLVLLADATSDIDSTLFRALMPRVWVGPSAAHVPETALSFNGQEVPDWLTAQIEPHGLRDDYVALAKALSEIKAQLPAPNRLLPVQTAVLRCLIVHNWRRLVLKHPHLPDALLSADWPGRRCHILVAELLGTFPRPKLADLTPKQAAA